MTAKYVNIFVTTKLLKTVRQKEDSDIVKLSNKIIRFSSPFISDKMWFKFEINFFLMIQQNVLSLHHPQLGRTMNSW